jgi:hypothetical protein
LETLLSPSTSYHLKHIPKGYPNALDVKGDKTPPSETQTVICRMGDIRSRGFVMKKIKPAICESNTLDLFDNFASDERYQSKECDL